mgnify:CR=1 FL=1
MAKIETYPNASPVSGGDKLCFYGCLGGGECVDACPFNALFMNDDGTIHLKKFRFFS